MRMSAPGKRGSLEPATRCYRAALTRLIKDGLGRGEPSELTSEEEAGFVMLADALQGLRRL